MIALLVLMVFYTDSSFKAAMVQVPADQCETMGQDAQKKITGDTIKDVQFKCVQAVAREHT